jgi:hypothetical protein
MRDDLCRSYGSWTLAAAAEHAVHILDSAAPERMTRVHRALLGAPPDPAGRTATETMVELLLGLAAFEDWRTLCPGAGRISYQDLPAVEALSQLLAYAHAFVEWIAAPQTPGAEAGAAPAWFGRADT